MSDAKIGRWVLVFWAHLWRLPVWLAICMGIGWSIDWGAAKLVGTEMLGGSARLFLSLLVAVSLVAEEKAERATRRQHDR